MRSHIQGRGMAPCPVRCHVWEGVGAVGPCTVRSNASCVMSGGTPPVDRQTHTSENITFPEFCWPAVKNMCVQQLVFSGQTINQ